MTLRIKRPLRVKPRLSNEHSPAVLEIAVNVAADLVERGWTPERAEEFAGRIVDNPQLWLTYSGTGATRDQLPRPEVA